MNARQKLHHAQLAEWAAKFSDQKISGLTVKQWCDQNHLSIHKYNYWKRLLKEEVVDQMLPDVVPFSVRYAAQLVRIVRKNRAPFRLIRAGFPLCWAPRDQKAIL